MGNLEEGQGGREGGKEGGGRKAKVQGSTGIVFIEGGRSIGTTCRWCAVFLYLSDGPWSLGVDGCVGSYRVRELPR